MDQQEDVNNSNEWNNQLIQKTYGSIAPVVKCRICDVNAFMNRIEIDTFDSIKNVNNSLIPYDVTLVKKHIKNSRGYIDLNDLEDSIYLLDQINCARSEINDIYVCEKCLGETIKSDTKDNCLNTIEQAKLDLEQFNKRMDSYIDTLKSNLLLRKCVLKPKLNRKKDMDMIGNVTSHKNLFSDVNVRKYIISDIIKMGGVSYHICLKELSKLSKTRVLTKDEIYVDFDEIIISNEKLGE